MCITYFTLSSYKNEKPQILHEFNVMPIKISVRNR